MITIKTSHGDIGIELFDEKAPISCENFRQYVTDKHFDGTIFHRVIPNFMVQGGGMDENMNSKPTRPARTGWMNCRRLAPIRWLRLTTVW